MDLFTLVGKIAVDASEATNNIQIVIDKVNELNLALNGAESGAQEAGEKTGESFGEAAEVSTKETGQTLSKWNVFLGNMATQAANAAYRMGKSFFQTGFEFNQNMEKWTASFKTYMGGDLEAASAFMEEVRQFAIETPLSLSDSVQSAVRLMASGFESGEVIDTLRMLGDIANGDTEKMSRLALVLSQVVSAKKLKGNDPNQFKEAGVPIYDLLLDYYHANGYDYIDEAFLQEMQRKGGITSEEVLGALQMATSEGGMYYNAMNNIMDTEYGQAQKLMDNYEQAAGSFTKAIFEVFASDTIPALNEILEKLNNWAIENPDALKNLAEAFSDLATGGIDVLVSSLTELLTFWSENQEMFNAMLVLFGGIAIKAGHPAAGLALITAGGYNVWQDEKEKYQAEAEEKFFGDGTDLPFMKQQFEWLGNLAGYENYFNVWKQRQIDAGYTEEQIASYVDNAFATYVPYTDAQMRTAFGEYKGSDPTVGNATWLDTIGERTKSLWSALWGTEYAPEHGAGQRTESDFYTYVPEEDDDEPFFDWQQYVPKDDGTSGKTGIVGTLSAIQSTLASLPAEVQAAVTTGASEGVGGITVTATITTGDVTLDSGTIVGEIAPQVDVKLGAANARAGRSV